MALKIVWTPQALEGLDNIIRYLEKNWSEKEIGKFIDEIESFISLLKKYPEMLQRSTVRPNLHRGPHQ
jgi:plasmid stabilization system protein ParE